MMKRNSIIKVVSLMLCLLTLVALFAACDDGNQLQQSTTPVSTDRTYGTLGIIPDDVDYGDETYKLLLWDNTKNTLFPTQEVSGENIKNDLFARNKMIESELGIKFDPTYMQSHMGSTEGGDQLYQEALVGREEYEALCCYSLYAGKLAIEGKLVDLATLEYPDATMEWYPNGIQTEWSVDDRLFFIATNSSVRNIIANWCIYANNTMINDKKLEDIEDVVLAGKWTLQKMKDYSRNWAVEAEGNSGKDEKDRVYGFTYIHRTCIDAFYVAAGFKATDRDADGNPVFTFFSKGEVENISTFMDTFLDIVKSPECYPGDHDAFSGNWTAPLKNKNAAFYAGAIDLYTNISADGTFSMIPLPKLNEEQENYSSIQNNAFEIWAVPKSGSDSTVGGLIIEAVCYDDYKNIAYKFFDLDFKYRYSNSDKGVKIFDMIRESWQADFARVWSVGSPFGALRNCIAPKANNLALTNTFANSIGGNKRDYEGNLRDLLTMVRAIKD